MRSWPALILAPLVALGQQSICLSLSRHACEQQTTLAMHLVSAGSLLLILAMTWLALHSWRAAHAPGDPPPGHAQGEDSAPSRLARFLGAAGMLVGGLSALVAVSMWMPVWVLQPCMA